MNQVALLITFAVLILLPVVPAYVLFKALPSTGNISGPLQGLGLKLTGAFAGYFALVVFIFMELPKIRQFVSPEIHQVWTVEGNLQDPSGNGILVGPCEVHFMPSPYGSFSSGWFKTTFVTNMTVGGEADFPHLSIVHTGFPPAEIPLDPEELRRQKLDQNLNLSQHTIVLRPIVLKNPPTPYQLQPSAQGQPAQVDPQKYLNVIGNSSSNGQ